VVIFLLFIDGIFPPPHKRAYLVRLPDIHLSLFSNLLYLPGVGVISSGYPDIPPKISRCPLYAQLMVHFWMIPLRLNFFSDFSHFRWVYLSITFLFRTRMMCFQWISPSFN